MWTSNATEKFDPMLSLFEYLGKPAGSKLGKEVYEASTVAKVKTSSHDVSTPKYTGKIIKYPKSFLDSYFKILPKSDQIESDDLPF